MISFLLKNVVDPYLGKNGVICNKQHNVWVTWFFIFELFSVFDSVRAYELGKLLVAYKLQNPTLVDQLNRFPLH